MDFKQQLAGYQRLINEELTKYLRHDDCYERRWNEAMEYSLMAGGKRLRPILMIATYQLFRLDIARCLPYAVAIEMVHNFSLIHDDLPGIDNDDFRHGKPTNHKQFDEATAILAGDGLFNWGYMVISDDLMTSDVADLPVKLRVLNEFSHAIDRLAAGEYVDTVETGHQVDMDELEYIHQNKTGELLKLSVRAGAILAGASEQELIKLTTYADKIGLAFQIKDDILSEEGDEKMMGKPVGNDRELGKCTYVSKYGLDKSKTILHELIVDAKRQLADFGGKAEFLVGVADYIENRNK